MIHPIQYLDAYARRGAKEHQVSIAEYRDCMDEQAVMEAWLDEADGWLRNGCMSRAWWNAVIRHKTAHCMVVHWLKHNPVLSAEKKHDLEYALAIVRRDARNAVAK